MHPAGGSGRVLGSAAQNLAVSIWFKTTQASGVLLGLASSLPGVHPCSGCTTNAPCPCCGSAATAT